MGDVGWELFQRIIDNFGYMSLKERRERSTHIHIREHFCMLASCRTAKDSGCHHVAKVGKMGYDLPISNTTASHTLCYLFLGFSSAALRV